MSALSEPVSAPPSPASSEFSVDHLYATDRRTPARWIMSHLMQMKMWMAIFILAAMGAELLNAMIPGFTGQAIDKVIGQDPHQARHDLVRLSILLLVLVLIRGAIDFVARFVVELIAKRLERDARTELFTSLLGKSQTFHNRQKVGDIMARATNDITQLNFMMSPGVDLITGAMTALIMPLFFMGRISTQLLITPLIFLLIFALSLRYYMRKLAPVSDEMRAQFGVVNAELNEAVRGIEVIKSTGQEAQERLRFRRGATKYRDLAIRQGWVQAWYLPTLFLAIAVAVALLHGLYLVDRGTISLGQLVAYMGLWGQFGFPTNISTFSFSMVQMGLAGARRVLQLINEDASLDQTSGGYTGTMKGDVVFDDVTFSYDGDPVLRNISFHARPGETVAIVGETGSGKSTLTKLVNRIYDVDSGRILIDGVDVREWDLDALRSQISAIEQDVTLFSRTVSENIAFSLGQNVDRERVVQAAKDAQAHEFIVELDKGYDTLLGERGVTLSGGQRQRLAIARALVTDPRMLILDDSTSAIDSATEDEIQKAISRLLDGRTTLLITHRLSQIRWADQVLLIRHGELMASGTHEQLLKESALYRRIFSHYDEVEAPTASTGAEA